MVNITICMLDPSKAIELSVNEESLSDHVFVYHDSQAIRYRCLVYVDVGGTSEIARKFHKIPQSPYNS